MIKGLVRVQDHHGSVTIYVVAVLLQIGDGVCVLYFIRFVPTRLAAREF